MPLILRSSVALSVLLSCGVAQAQTENERPGENSTRVDGVGASGPAKARVGSDSVPSVETASERRLPPSLAAERLVPYTGGPIPPGATLDDRGQRKLYIPGFLILGVGHTGSTLFTLVASTYSFGGIRLPESKCQLANLTGVLPVVGPLAVATNVSSGYCRSSVSTAATAEKNSWIWKYAAVASGVQAVGAAMAIVGLVRRDSVLVYEEVDTASWQVAPGTEMTPNGVTLAARF